jgi:tyrosinase
MTFRNAAHSGPAFYPWHREFLLRYERDLGIEMGDPNFALPYWDWAADAALANPAASPIWGTDLMGGDGAGANDAVQTGPFRSVASGGTWLTLELDMMGNPLPSGPLTRTLGRPPTGSPDPGPGSLPSQGDVTTTLGIVPYDVADWSRDSPGGFRVRAEGWHPHGMHNQVHVWIGGSMGPGTSPNDPVFFLHHSNVDRIWNRWQAQNPGQGFLPVSGGPAGHNLNDALFPWNTAGDTRKPSDLLDSKLLGYKYDTDP